MRSDSWDDSALAVAEVTPLSLIGRAVIATIAADLTEPTLARLRADLLARVHAARATGVVFDVTSLPLMDPWEFEQLRSTAAMARLLGARVVLAGVQPGAVEVLATIGASFAGFDATVQSVDDALRILTGGSR